MISAALAIIENESQCNELLTIYEQNIMTGQAPYWKDGKRYDIADAETAYMCSLSIKGNLAAWNYDCANGVFPIVYDLEKDTAIVLDAERSVYWSFVSDNTVYFVEYPNDSQGIRIITYSTN